MKSNESESGSGYGMIMAGLCLIMVVACLDSTVVTTCGPIIVADLGGEEIYSWILTSYLLCETIMIPISGKLSDLYGRKPFLVAGLMLFVVGSIACGLCEDMTSFILCRAIQGFGGGILIPVATSAVGDLYYGEDRAKMLGLLSAMFGIGSGIGPLLGAYVTEYMTWHWVFFINIPLVAICAFLVFRGYPTTERNREVRIDYKGIMLLSLFLLDLLLLIEWADDEFAWISVEAGVMAFIAVSLLALFVLVERRAVDPVLPPRIIRNPVVTKSVVFMFIFGFAMMGANTYISFIAINVLGYTVIEAGQYAMAVVIGMIVTSTLSGATVSRVGCRPWLTVGPILAAIGLFMLSTIILTTPLWYILVSLFFFGLGLGCIMSVVYTAVQDSAEPDEIGMTTSAVNLLRNIGSTTGTAVFTMIINASISSHLDALVPGTITQEICNLIPHDTSIVVAANMPVFATLRDTLIGVFVDSFEVLFVFAAVVVACLVFVGLMYRDEGKAH